MPELPEISLFARDMQVELVGRTIRDVEVLQPKCLNLPVDEFRIALSGSQIQSVSSHGKWLQVKTTRGWLLFNLGMGGEILLTDRDHLPEKPLTRFCISSANPVGRRFVLPAVR